MPLFSSPSELGWNLLGQCLYVHILLWLASLRRVCEFHDQLQGCLFFCLRLLRGSPSLHFWDELHIHAGIVCLRPRWLCKRWCGINLPVCALCHFSLWLQCISALWFQFDHETDDYGLSETPQDCLFVCFCWCLVQEALRGAILRRSMATVSKEMLWLGELIPSWNRGKTQFSISDIVHFHFFLLHCKNLTNLTSGSQKLTVKYTVIVFLVLRDGMFIK